MILPDVDELLEILNDGFNPYLSDIQSSDLQVYWFATATAVTV